MFEKAKLYKAIKESNIEEVKRLLESGVNPNKSILFFYRDSPLIEAIAVQSLDIVELLLKYNANPNQKGRFVYPIELAGFHHLSHNNVNSIESLRIVKYLLVKGAEINKKNEGIVERLLIAAGLSGTIDLIETLLEYGADINQMDNPNFYKLHPASLMFWLQNSDNLPTKVKEAIYNHIESAEALKKHRNEEIVEYIQNVEKLKILATEKGLFLPN